LGAPPEDVVAPPDDTAPPVPSVPGEVVGAQATAVENSATRKEADVRRGLVMVQLLWLGGKATVAPIHGVCQREVAAGCTTPAARYFSRFF
jgi:hypothetical protein